jgi:hypothetical protein
MNYIKSFWTSSPPSTTALNGEQSNSIPFQNTTVTTSGNATIITTIPSTSTQQVRYHHHHHHHNPSLKPHSDIPEMISPTDSFYSTSSTFEHEKVNNGRVNFAFNESAPEINNNNNTSNSNHHHHHGNNNVVDMHRNNQ